MQHPKLTKLVQKKKARENRKETEPCVSVTQPRSGQLNVGKHQVGMGFPGPVLLLTKPLLGQCHKQTPCYFSVLFTTHNLG